MPVAGLFQVCFRYGSCFTMEPMNRNVGMTLGYLKVTLIKSPMTKLVTAGLNHSNVIRGIRLFGHFPINKKKRPWTLKGK